MEDDSRLESYRVSQDPEISPKKPPSDDEEVELRSYRDIGKPADYGRRKKLLFSKQEPPPAAKTTLLSAKPSDRKNHSSKLIDDKDEQAAEEAAQLELSKAKGLLKLDQTDQDEDKPSKPKTKKRKSKSKSKKKAAKQDDTIEEIKQEIVAAEAHDEQP